MCKNVIFQKVLKKFVLEGFSDKNLHRCVPHCKDWRDLANQIVITRRQTRFRIFKSNNYKIGMNILSNRFFALNNLIELNDLGSTLPCFKKKMKCLFFNF